jgi:hypothetical protein
MRQKSENHITCCRCKSVSKTWVGRSFLLIALLEWCLIVQPYAFGVQEERLANEKRHADVEVLLKRAFKLAQRRQDPSRAVKANKVAPGAATLAPVTAEVTCAVAGNSRIPAGQAPSTAVDARHLSGAAAAASAPWEHGSFSAVGTAVRGTPAVDDVVRGAALIKDETGSAVHPETARSATPHRTSTGMASGRNDISTPPLVLCELQHCDQMLPVQLWDAPDAAALRRTVWNAFAADGHTVPDTHILVAVDTAGESMAVSDQAPWLYTQQTTVALKLIAPGS